MKPYILHRMGIAIAAAAIAIPAMQSYAGGEPQPPSAQPFTVSEAFVKMPALVLDILSTDMRRDLLDGMKKDSVAAVPNVMGAFSTMRAPVTDDYLSVEITPVSRLTMRLLPYGSKGRKVVAAVYTVGDSLQSADSDLRFYDENMAELPRDKFIRIASTPDFFDFKGAPSDTRRDIINDIPFPTVLYTLSPYGTELTAALTVDGYLGKETVERMKPWFVPEITYVWDGRKFKPTR